MKERYFGGDRGFTLIELLAVITIIALLAGGLVVSVGFFSRRAMTARTKSIVMTTEQAIHSFYDDYGAYPPEYYESKNAEFFGGGGGDENPFNKDTYIANYRFRVHRDKNYLRFSSTILYYFLVTRYDEGDLEKHPRKTAYAEFPEYAIKDVDDNGYNEIVDAWGNPLLYVAKDLYADAPISEGHSTTTNVEPHHDKNMNSFSLYSYGNDGLGYYKDSDEEEYDEWEDDYPVQHKSISDGQMPNKITEKYGARRAVEKANRDDVINWKEY